MPHGTTITPLKRKVSSKMKYKPSYVFLKVIEESNYHLFSTNKKSHNNRAKNSNVSVKVFYMKRQNINKQKIETKKESKLGMMRNEG